MQEVKTKIITQKKNTRFQKFLLHGSFIDQKRRIPKIAKERGNSYQKMKRSPDEVVKFKNPCKDPPRGPLPIVLLFIYHAEVNFGNI